MGLEVIFDDKVYFKNKTFVASFTMKRHVASAMQFNGAGLDSPSAFYDWLSDTSKELGDKYKCEAIITYANIL